MYYDDHGPAHFPAYYGGDSVSVVINTLEVQEGRLPRRALAMVLEWAAEHRDDLRTNGDVPSSTSRSRTLRHWPSGWRREDAGHAESSRCETTGRVSVAH